MIQSVQSHQPAQEMPRGTQSAAAADETGSSSFQALFSEDTQPVVAATSGTSTTAAAATTAATAAAVAASSSAGEGDIFSPSAIENHMNQWLMGILQQQNDAATAAYDNQMAGWQNTNEHNLEMGLPEVAAPPAPQLAKVEPMPAGWWFSNS